MQFAQQLLNFKLFPLILGLAAASALIAKNPYRRSLELLLQEPSSGPYTKIEAAAVEELWITQPLDHFNETHHETWQMRYLQNGKYHKPGGPIFIFVGGEWSITPGLLSTGLTHDMAVENGGMLYYTEHRHYGQSLPNRSRPFSVSNLSYLTLNQSLADLAHFIRYQRTHNQHLSKSKVILIGGSYSGSLVTWMTEAYPNLVAASWASSAPLEAKADFYEYMQLAMNSLRLGYGQNCTERVELGLQHLVDMFKANQTGELLNRVNACPNFQPENQLDRMSFFSGIANYFAFVVQGYSDFIPALCGTLMSIESSEEESLLRYLELLYNGDARTECQDFSYEAMLQLFSETADQSSGTRAWFYQTCKQFGWYTTTISSGSSSTSFFSSSSFGGQVPLWYFEQLCQDAFGSEKESSTAGMQLEAGIVQLNGQFGGQQFNQSVRYREVIFTHGQLDPWRALGQQRGKQSIIVAGYSHVEDLGSINVRDSVALNLAKLRVMSFLRRHIASI